MSQINPNPYEIERLTGRCASTGRVLEPGETYIATLVEEVESAPGEGDEKSAGPRRAAGGGALNLRRVDVSLAAWEGGYRPEHLFSHWRSTVPEPSARKKVFVDDTVLMNLFTRLEQADSPQRLAFRFVLGLILMRKRLLRYDGSEQRSAPAPGSPAPGNPGGQEIWRMTPKLDPAKGPMGKWDEQHPLELLNPRLNDEQIQQVTEQLGEILEGEL